MALAPTPAICLECGKDFESAPRRSTLGFDKFACPHCKAKVLYPLPGWRRGVYLGLLAPAAAVVAFVAYGLAVHPARLGDEGRLVGLLWIPVVAALCRDHYFRKRLQAAQSSAEPEQRRAALVGLGGWPRSREAVVFWGVVVLTYAPLFYLRHRTQELIRSLGKTAAAGFRNGDYKSSADALDRLVGLGLAEKTPELLAQRGYARVMAGSFETGLPDAEQALRRDPAMPLPYVTRCVAAEGAKAWDKALTQCGEALEKVPGDQKGLLVIVRSKLGSSKFSAGDYLGALSEFSVAIDLNPSDAGLYLERAWVAAMIGPKEDAEADIRKALELDPRLKEHPSRAAALLAAPNFEPLVHLSLRRARETLASLAVLELARARADQKWAMSVDELLAGVPDADKTRARLTEALVGGAVTATAQGSGLLLSCRAKATLREVTASGDASGFVVPELKWERGSFEPVRIAPPPKPKKRARKKRPTR
ncbi:MAG: tetratricopeptide repeat protein [Elusimicrobia bacterium]|nr:tetratricopeptide repeat protein [Elusimicrobiota bacterium]